MVYIRNLWVGYGFLLKIEPTDSSKALEGKLTET